MATTSLCECGRECKTAAVLLTCDICGGEKRAGLLRQAFGLESEVL